MSKLLVRSFSISLDGFGAGPNQDIANPLGVGGMALHKWFFDTLTFKRMHGQEGGNTGVDEDFAARSFANVGAWILGRNMFGPVRGPWRDESWKGWWGDNPPYHTPVFVLTNHPRTSIVMEGGTVFHFVWMALTLRWSALRKVRVGKTCGSAVEWPPFGSTCSRG